MGLRPAFTQRVNGSNNKLPKTSVNLDDRIALQSLEKTYQAVKGWQQLLASLTDDDESKTASHDHDDDDAKTGPPNKLPTWTDS